MKDHSGAEPCTQQLQRVLAFFPAQLGSHEDGNCPRSTRLNTGGQRSRGQVTHGQNPASAARDKIQVPVLEEGLVCKQSRSNQR